MGVLMGAIKLHHDGDTHELADGRILRLRIEPDYDSTIEDYEDCVGRVAFCTNGIWTAKPRPDDFDGNSEKLWVQQNGDCYWWQPPADVKRDTDEFRSLRGLVDDLLAFGWNVYVVELCEGTDVYGQPIVREVEALGGVEAMCDDEYRDSIVSELVGQLGVEL